MKIIVEHVIQISQTIACKIVQEIGEVYHMKMSAVFVIMILQMIVFKIVQVYGVA